MDYQEAIEELKSLKEHCFDMIDKEDKDSVWIKDCEALSVAISAMQELQEYKQLGTLEEVRDAVEKQKERKPIKQKESRIRYTDGYICPRCGGGFTGTGIADYCYHCGQKILWERVTHGETDTDED